MCVDTEVTLITGPLTMPFFFTNSNILIRKTSG